MDIESAKKRLCVALDVSSIEQAIHLVSLLKDDVGLFKVGSELYTSAGPDVVKRVIELGGQILLDLKYHDIPNTVAQAARIVTHLGVTMFNLHAAGGSEMISAAVTASREEAYKLKIQSPRVLAVTILTSIDDSILSKELLIPVSIKDAVRHLAQLAKTAGADGVVASPQEVTLIRDACGPDFLIVTPGIRPKQAIVDDQKRITTPTDAIKMGSDYIVVGRPILATGNPIEAARVIVKEIEGAML
jgi:orotidine-5'-phosphate decarboxylase